MKKALLIIMLGILIVPNVSYAFSFSDLFWWRNKGVEQIQEKTELNVQQKLGAEDKLATWIEAYNKTDLGLLVNNEQYTNISTAEFNYILQEQLKKYSNPPIQDITVSLKEGKFILEGYALRPLKGNVYAEVRIEVMDEQLYFHVIKARYKGLFVPGSLIGRLIYNQSQFISEFFFAGDAKLKDIVVGDENVEFVIE